MDMSAWSADIYRRRAMIIAGRKIGPEHEPFVIAELGLNHAGDFRLAVEMVHAAKVAGAHCVKLQTHCDDEFSDIPAYPGNAGGESIQDFVKRCSLNEHDESVVFEYARNIGIICISTPFSPMAVERLEKLNVPAYKAGSGQLRDLPLLRMLQATEKPVILSTGMGDDRAIKDAYFVFDGIKIQQLAMLHCTSEYPTPFDHVRLGCLKRWPFDIGTFGLSDHTGTIYPSLGAVALGASILEVHLKLSSCPDGPDLPVSITPDELRQLVTGSKAIWECRGGTKEVLPGEAETLKWFTASRRK